MDQSINFDVVKEINEIKNQLCLSKRLGFFFGAGSSMALGIPSMFALTKQVKEKIDKRLKGKIAKIEEDLNPVDTEKSTIEDILNHIRLIRQITRDNPRKHYNEINGEEAKEIDNAICHEIYNILSIKESEILLAPDYRLKIIEKLLAWFNLFGRDYEKEIFTTNYDLIFEKALENLQIPYFDGFVGANKPFFLPESLEARDHRETPPLSWFRLWKLHGSLGWFWDKSNEKTMNKVVRMGIQAKGKGNEEELTELVIYPSREKYESSRKQPFISYFDRFKRFLSDGEGILIISGYSFGDEHINEVIFNGLRQNNRLHIVSFFFKDEEIEKIKEKALLYLNMSLFGPQKAIIGGDFGRWNLNVESDDITTCWDKEKSNFLLGDFRNLVNFLVASSGKRQIIEEMIEGKR